jgi:hypothetical protein
MHNQQYSCIHNRQENEYYDGITNGSSQVLKKQNSQLEKINSEFRTERLATQNQLEATEMGHPKAYGQRVCNKEPDEN